MMHHCFCVVFFCWTRSYAALRAADLDWIVGPGYSLGRVHSGKKPGINKNVTHLHGVTTDQGRGGRAGISKNVTHLHGVTTDLLDV